MFLVKESAEGAWEAHSKWAQVILWVALLHWAALIQLSTSPMNRDVLRKRKVLLKNMPLLNTAALGMDPFGDYRACLHGHSEMDNL